MRIPLIAVALSTLLSGCANLDANRDFVRAQSESNPAGVKGLIRGNELRALNVANLVGSFETGWVPVAASTDPAVEQQATDKAIAVFYQSVPDGRQANYRNEIQDRIIAAANQRCHLWKNYFATASSTVGFWSGVTGAATGAASLAFKPPATKAALTALSTTSTSVGTQFEKSYLFSLTMQVIFQGVESRRADILHSVVEKRSLGDRQLTPIGRYSLSAAIADALEYHAACSVASGLQQASEKLSDARPDNGKPGTDTTTPPSGNATPQANSSTSPSTADGKKTSSPASVPLT